MLKILRENDEKIKFIIFLQMIRKIFLNSHPLMAGIGVWRTLPEVGRALARPC
jgi:hypothetical protein